MSMLKVRHSQYRAPETGSTSNLSFSLLVCAESELREALADRGPGKARTADNHWSPHSVGSILLLIAGLEAWLNESTLMFGHKSAGLRSKSELPIRKKYCAIPRVVAGSSIMVSTDLDLLLRVRDEVAHFLPMTLEEIVPEWLSDLQSRGLFITSCRGKKDYDFGVKLGSYALAYWAWDTVSQAVAGFLGALGEQGEVLLYTSSNFEGFRSLCEPERLAEYDAAEATLRGRLGRWLRGLGLGLGRGS